MTEARSFLTAGSTPRRVIDRLIARIKQNKYLFAIGFGTVLALLVPFYGVLFPPNVDLPEHIIVGKLLFEKITGVSNLDIEISPFIGYRLSPILLASVLGLCKLIGIPLTYLPKIFVSVLLALHAVVIVVPVYLGLGERNRRSAFLAFCFALPAAVAMYSASWFIGFVGYSLAVTLLVPAVFFTERFLRAGKLKDAALLFVFLILIYTAHPFVEVFWLLWCGSRGLAALITRTIVSEWKWFLLLGAMFLPIYFYHSWATSGTELAVLDQPWFAHSPFIPPSAWYSIRVNDILDGNLFKTDYWSDPRLFTLSALGLIACTLLLAWRQIRTASARNMMLAASLFMFISTWINEEFIPKPFSLWIAWDYRYTSTVFVVCLAVTAVVLTRSIPPIASGWRAKLVYTVLAGIALVGSISQLVDVQKAYARFDPPARQFMEKVFAHESPADIPIPHGRWHPDGTLIKLYICLQEPDCNPDGTNFKSLGGNIWAVSVRGRLAPPQPQPVPSPTLVDFNAFTGGEGKLPGQFATPRGIAVGRDGSIYVADSGNARVQKFDPEGRPAALIGSAGAEPGQFLDPNGIAVDAAGNVYVIDAGNGKLIRFKPDGTFDREWRGPDPGFYGGRDVVIGANKSVYVVDQGNSRIVRFDSSTETFSSWGSRGGEPGQFLEPTGIGTGGGFIFVADLANNRIQVFDMDGVFVREWPVPIWEKYPWHYPDVAYDEASETIYATNGWHNEILAFDIQGRPAQSALENTASAELSNPSSIVIAAGKKQTNVFVLNTGRGSVSQFVLGQRRTSKK